MLRAIRFLYCPLCLILTTALLAQAPLPQPKPSTPLLVTTDLDCDWTLDGISQGRLRAREVKAVQVPSGDHLVQASSTDGQDTFQTVVTVGQSQKAVQIVLSTVRQSREKEAAERRLAEERKQEEARKQKEVQSQQHLIWSDRTTGLMWTRQDNGRHVEWEDAKNYCANLRLGGYLNWRLATTPELGTIYDPTQNVYMKGDPTVWHIRGGIDLSGWTWSSSAGTVFHFGNGQIYSVDANGSFNRRALCVRRAAE